MDDFEKSMRELAKVNVIERAERPSVSRLKDNYAPTTPPDRMLDGLQKANEENISRLRGQIGRLSTYIDRIVGIQPEPPSVASTSGLKEQPNGKLSELFALGSELDLELRRLTAEIERLDVI